MRAAAEFVKSHPTITFRVAGEAEMRSELQRLIASLGLQDRFQLLGTVTDIPAFLAGLDIAVLCSQTEGAPNAIMEYMVAGLPIVATAVGGNAEMIEAETSGLLVPPGDVAGLSAAIDRLVRDNSLATRVAATAREKALREYGVDVYAQRYEEVYLRLAKRKVGLVRRGRAPIQSHARDKGR